MTPAEQWIQEGAEIGKKQGYRQGLLEGMNWILRFRFGTDAATLMPMLQTIQEPETLKKIEQALEQAQQLAEIKALIEQYRVIPPKQDEYAILDELIGICETGRSDASLHHDAILYGKSETENIR